ncbi:MAG: DUF1800 domain-containing protein [Saprospiraceae bacterium]|nr:DUF1800 domain-containing protein [Saprospiraceae bacterium]
MNFQNIEKKAVKSRMICVNLPKINVNSMLRKFFILIFVGLLAPAVAQKVILGGPGSKITSQSSNNRKLLRWEDSAASQNTIDGKGLTAELHAASRFLYQTTLGSDKAEIERVANIGFDKWIDEQTNAKPSYMIEELQHVIKDVVDWHYLNGGDSIDAPAYFYSLYFNYAWWNLNLKNNDELRQRVAFALSEIFVTSANSDLGGYADAMCSYYDVLIKHSLGNFRDLLNDITYHPAMGLYLSHLNNPPTDTSDNTRPDENYAREIMQLFTIGLFELNNNGTLKKDSKGNAIPTYTQRDIQELAKVFTGMTFSAVKPNPWQKEASFPTYIYTGDPTKPMKVYETDPNGESVHEPGPKTLIGNYVTKWPQTGEEDVQDALTHLFNHPNVPPFFCKQLIQRLIKSNPSPEYIERISNVFINDGKGIRGNLAAVVRAIIMDEEARTCEWLQDDFNGMLREPILKYTHFVKAVGVEQYYDRYYNSSYHFFDNTNQIPMHAPSVFNFFNPAFQPKGPIADNNLVGPEFHIYNSKTSIGFMNMVNNWIYDYVMFSWMDKDPYTVLSIDELMDLSRDPEVLLNRLDMILTHGNLTFETKNIVKNIISKFTTGNFRSDRVRCALYLIMISPDYAIFK